jgi:hypothetical protein
VKEKEKLLYEVLKLKKLSASGFRMTVEFYNWALEIKE